MKGMMLGLVLAGIAVAGVVGAQAPAGAPAGSTGICKDGTYSTQTSKQGACRGHKGIQTWYVADGAPAAGTSAAKSMPAATAAAKPSAAIGAQASGPAPAGATGRCKDGTYTTQASKQGACRGHKGVDTWMGEGAAAPASAGIKPPMGMPSPAPAAVSKPAPLPTAASPAAAPTPSATAPASTSSGKKIGPASAGAAKLQAAGGGPGLVWVNMESKVYHCNGDEFYGKTKQGSYMTEAQAQTAGARGARGKSCAGK
jgi:hypothetical protein